MNRRSFISTITALAGIVLAKIKAPAAILNTAKWRRGVAMLTRCAWCEKATSNLITYTAQGSDGFYHGAAVCRECYAAKTNTCPRCGAEGIPGYELICCCNPDPVQRITDEHTLPLQIRLKP